MLLVVISFIDSEPAGHIVFVAFVVDPILADRIEVEFTMKPRKPEDDFMSPPIKKLIPPFSRNQVAPGLQDTSEALGIREGAESRAVFLYCVL
jgi:hypothetical protein